MSYKSELQSCSCLDISREVTSGEQRYVCYTQYSDLDQQFVIGVSNGLDVWRIGLAAKDVRDRSGTTGESTYLRDIGQTLREGEVCVTQSGMTMTLKCGSLETFKLSKEDSCDHLKNLIFTLLDELQSTRSKLKDCEKELQTSKRQAAADKPVYADVTMRGSSSKLIGRPKRATGTSLVNPTSKKRKAATGVIFDSNSQTDS